MNKIKFLLLLCVPFVSLTGEETIATLHLQTDNIQRSNTPVSVSVENLPLQNLHGLHLFRISDGERHVVPSQIIPGYSPRLYWIVDQAGAATTLHYELVRTDKTKDKIAIKVDVNEQRLLLQKAGKNILQYNCTTVYPPEGVDTIYKRSGFIHPLWSPQQSVLTRIQPDDHYHHYGIWGPWTKTHIGDREIDFWNLVKGHGTVRFAGVASIVEGDVFSGFKVRQEHVDFGARGGDQVAINEILDVRVWNVKSGFWMVDYTITLNCPADTVMLDAYRYGGGIGFRAVESWIKENVRVLTSEGKTRVDADGTNARWCDVSGENEQGERSGILFMSHPHNRKHPEPMRVWPVNANKGRGDMFFEFCPIRHFSWQLIPRQDYVLKYRLLVYEEGISAQEAENAWQNFANPPQVILNP